MQKMILRREIGTDAVRYKKTGGGTSVSTCASCLRTVECGTVRYTTLVGVDPKVLTTKVYSEAVERGQLFI